MTAKHVVPLEKAPDAVVSVPGSKSYTNRALALGALARGTTVLRGALFSDDSLYFFAAAAICGGHLSQASASSAAKKPTASAPSCKS